MSCGMKLIFFCQQTSIEAISGCDPAWLGMPKVIQNDKSTIAQNFMYIGIYTSSLNLGSSKHGQESWDMFLTIIRLQDS